MKLYLVQHAESKRKDEDLSRSLSDKGRRDIRKMAKYAGKHLHIEVIQIAHSGKLRAKQTAEVLAEYLQPGNGVIAAEDLEPLADPNVWNNRLAETTENIMLVGHLPHLGKLASLLLTLNGSEDVVKFRNGGITCLERDESGRWAVQWVVSPEIIP